MKTEKQTKTVDETARRRVVLVGTYKGDQLKDWPGSVSNSIATMPNEAALSDGRAVHPVDHAENLTWATFDKATFGNHPAVRV